MKEWFIPRPGSEALFGTNAADASNSDPVKFSAVMAAIPTATTAASARVNVPSNDCDIASLADATAESISLKLRSKSAC